MSLVFLASCCSQFMFTTGKKKVCILNSPKLKIYILKTIEKKVKKIIFEVLFFCWSDPRSTFTQTHQTHTEQHKLSMLIYIYIFIRSLVKNKNCVPITSIVLEMSLFWRLVGFQCSAAVNKTGMIVNKTDRDTSCAAELPMLLWTFGSITAGSSDKTKWKRTVRAPFHHSGMVNTPS